MDRYNIVIEKHRRGDYARHRKIAEAMLRANGKLMEGLGNLEYHIKSHS